ncbi:MAG TPA: HEAT repeat domain-containing protein, partial [Chloroflexota bacterium]|nr:HEAT repeat domain-containing protein [Chloroflexota bacterium]
MSSRRIPVAAMYRPRFIANPTVPTQMGQDGKREVDHAEICYSDPSARQWGLTWGERILDKCPGFSEIIIYNPLNHCRCPECSAAFTKGPNAAVLGFLSEARSAWRAKRPGVKLGLVYMPAPDFWKSVLPVVDIAHPFLRIRDDVDAARDVADIRSVRSVAKEKMGACLAKITWEEGAKVSTDKLRTVDSLAASDGISYFLWTFDTLFTSSLYDPRAVAQALGLDPEAVGEAVGSMHGQLPQGTGEPGSQEYTPEEIRGTSAETFLDRLQNGESGYHPFAALHALTQKAKESEASQRRSIITVVVKAMHDTQRPVNQRFQCCYVLSGCGDEQSVPELIKVLFNDASDTMRGVAAEALADFPKNTAAHEALLKAARQDNSPNVREVLTRRLGQSVVESQPAADPVAASPADERSPSGPPKPPAGPKSPVAKPLSWPFPGDQQAQGIFNNYQQATDVYIHCGLDFIHAAGTPVTAVGAGYVAAIYTNYPSWKTH